MTPRTDVWHVLGRFVDPLAAAALTSVACTQLLHYFADPVRCLPALAAAVLGALVGALPPVRRCGPTTLVVVTFAGGVALAAAVVLPIAPHVAGGLPARLRLVPDRLVHGWARMLTVDLPVPPGRVWEVLALPVALAWAAALAACALAHRSRTALPPMLPPLLLFVGLLALTSSRPQPRLVATAGFLAVGSAWALARAHRLLGPVVADRDPVLGSGSARPGRPYRATAFGAGLVAAAAALGVVAAAALPCARDRLELRSLALQQVRTDSVISPLQALKSVLTGPEQVVLHADVTTDGPLPDGLLRLRLAAFDTFNGRTWPLPSRLTTLPERLAAQDGPAAPGVRVHVVATIERPEAQLPDHLMLLPVLGRPTNAGARAAYEGGGDDGSDVVAVYGREADHGYRYLLDDNVPFRDPVALRTASAVRAATCAQGCLSPTDALRWAGHATSAYDQLDGITARLAALRYGLVAPGESMGDVQKLLSARPPASFAEQRAVAFVVLARSLGLRARVVVGYAVPVTRAGTVHLAVTTRQAHAWAEVEFEGIGWVPFEPTPPSAARAATTSSPAQGATGPVRIRQNTPVTTAGSDRGPRKVIPVPLLPNLPLLHHAPSRVPVQLLFCAPAVPAAVWGLKMARRRRRRRAGGSSRRLVGAWSEALDRLVEAGLTAVRALTPDDVCEHVERLFGPEAARPLAGLVPLVEEAVCSPREPQEGSVELAWSCERELALVLGRRLPPVVRWGRHVDPRPLVGRR